MLSTEPSSAVVIRIALPPSLARLRSRWDWAASVGVPAHVTIVFPFVPAGRLGPAVRRELAEIAGHQQPFEIRFDRVGQFPSVVYLAPDPVDPVKSLIASVVATFPDYPPYGGAHDVVIPHLTITESATAPLDLIATQATERLPFAHRVTSLEVLVEAPDGRWRPRWRLPLGVRR
jgi:2'-5' RNA ligase